MTYSHWIVGFIMVILVCGILTSVFPYIKAFNTTDNGEHTGIVTAVERNGLIWKTWTIYFKSDVQSSQEDDYCVIDNSLIDKLKDFSENKTKITITYDDYLFIGYGLCGGENGIITGIK